MKEVKERQSKWGLILAPGWLFGIGYCTVLVFTWFDLDILCNPNLIAIRLFYGYWETNPDIYTGRWRTQSGKCHVEEAKQSWGINTLTPRFTMKPQTSGQGFWKSRLISQRSRAENPERNPCECSGLLLDKSKGGGYLVDDGGEGAGLPHAQS